MKYSLIRGIAQFLCHLLSFCSLFYFGSFFSLVQARSDASPLRRAGKSEVRNRLDSWDRPFGAVLSEAKTALFHYDGQLSTRQLTDSNAQVSDSYTYDAFGVILASSGSTANNYLYAGEQLDPNMGFYYLRARHYNHANGRFISQDPFHGISSEPISFHRYLYANADPEYFLDPSGLLSMTEMIGVAVVIMILHSLKSSTIHPTTVKTVPIAVHYAYGVSPYFFTQGLILAKLEYRRWCLIDFQIIREMVHTYEETVMAMGPDLTLDENNDGRLTTEERLLTSGQPTDVINVYAVHRLSRRSPAETITAPDGSDTVIISETYAVRALAHEFAHVLLRQDYHDPDEGNIMYGAAIGGTRITEGQCAIMRNHPLAR